MLFYVFGSCLRYQFHILNFENEKKPLSLSLQEESFTWKSSASKKQFRTKNSLSFFYILILYFLIFILFLFTFCWSKISWVYVSFVFRWVTVRLNFTWRKRQSRKSISLLICKEWIEEMRTRKNVIGWQVTFDMKTSDKITKPCHQHHVICASPGAVIKIQLATLNKFAPLVETKKSAILKWKRKWTKLFVNLLLIKINVSSICLHNKQQQHVANYVFRN